MGHSRSVHQQIWSLSCFLFLCRLLSHPLFIFFRGFPWRDPVHPGFFKHTSGVHWKEGILKEFFTIRPQSNGDALAFIVAIVHVIEPDDFLWINGLKYYGVRGGCATFQ